jgi:hypothetical protein
MKAKKLKEDALMQVKLSPETKYFAVLFSKRAGTTLSEFVAECVDAVLATSTVTVAGKALDYKKLTRLLWAEHPADRFALLATHFPGELTLREQLLWLGVVKQSQAFWNVPLMELYRTKQLTDVINLGELRKKWDSFDSMNRDEIAALAQTIKQENQAGLDSNLPPELKELRENIRAQLSSGGHSSKPANKKAGK